MDLPRRLWEFAPEICLSEPASPVERSRRDRLGELPGHGQLDRGFATAEKAQLSSPARVKFAPPTKRSTQKRGLDGPFVPFFWPKFPHQKKTRVVVLD